MLITRKIEITVSRKDEEQYQKSWNLIRFLDDNLYKAANTVVSHQYFNHELKTRLQISHPKYRQVKKELDKIDQLLLDTTIRTDKDVLHNQRRELFTEMKQITSEIDQQQKAILNTSLQNTTYQVISEMFPNIPSTIRTSLNSVVQQSYKVTFTELLQGKRSLPTYRKGMPIPFQFSSTFKKDEDGNVSFGWLQGTEFVLRFGRDRSNNRSILDKILSGEYKARDSSIQLKDTKLFLLLVVDIGELSSQLDTNLSVGVDLGINVPVYVALNDGFARQSIGSREEFLNIRLRLQARKRQVQRDLKHANGGRGRSKKLSALDTIQDKERNFVRTQNHTFAREVINFALKYNAGVIQMEKLEGIGDRLENSFLTRNWSYFELQQLISYKAKYYNIEVRFINPKHTSQTCSFCNHWEEGQRLTQKDFLCKNEACTNKDENGANKVVNADYNGARNIAKSRVYV